MEKQFFRILAKINQALLPSFTRRRLDITRASKFQLAVIGWRAWVTKRAINQ